MKDKIFVVPQNDLESREIIKLLEEAGYKRGENLFVTNQGWGASWKGLEPEIKAALREKTDRFRITKVIPAGKYHGGEIRTEKISRTELQDMSAFMKERMRGEPVPLQPDFSSVYGVELKGNTLCHNIDHHAYCDRNWETGNITYQDDRAKDKDGKPKLSAIEQVAELINVELTLDQKFIAANDRGFVEGMREYGESIFYTPEEISEKITDIRMREHAILAEVQGITPEMEKQAEIAIDNAKTLENGTLCVRLPHSKCSTITDRIPEQEYNGGLLIVCGDGKTEKEVDYYGPTETVCKLAEHLGGWTGDTSQSHTFWGMSDWPDRDKLMAIVQGQDPEQVLSREGQEAPALDI